MPILSEDQVRRAIEAMREYLHSPENSDGVTPVQRQKELDQRRIDLIENVLGPLVESFLAGKIPLAEFKSQVDGINKRNQLWGFKGIKGQMFFNMVFNVADDVRECEEELKAAIAIPANEDIASSRIKTFASYVNRIGQQFVETGGSNYGKPKVSSVPFFLSYFWQIQDHTKWPVYYTNSVNVMGDLNLWQPNGDLAQDYLEYKRVHEELSREFTEASGTSFTLYDVEHVFWFKGGNPYGGATPLSGQPEETGRTTEGPPEGVTTRGLPDSYVPPIVSILARLGRNDPELSALAE